jgi:hypothetical protein
MLRLMFVLASVLAVLGGVTAGSPLQRLVAGLVAVALLAHRAVVQRQLRHTDPATAAVPGHGRPALGALGRLDR